MSSLKNSSVQFLKDFQTGSLVQFQKAVKEITEHFTQRSVVTLSGPMGAGKTEFVKTAAQLKGISDVASPTFAIHHRYQSKSSKTAIEHLDLFRLKSADDLESTGFWDLFFEPEGLIFIEWPERMDLTLIPESWDLFSVEIQKISAPNENEKRILRLSRRYDK